MTLINCPECGYEVNIAEQYCPNCGFILIKKSNSVKKNKIYARIIISITFIFIAIALVTTREFIYYLGNLSYFAEKYAEMKMRSNGFFGGHYATIAFAWKGMYDKALMHIMSRGIGAAVLVIIGCVGLYRGLKKFKESKEMDNGSY